MRFLRTIVALVVALIVVVSAGSARPAPLPDTTSRPHPVEGRRDLTASAGEPARQVVLGLSVCTLIAAALIVFQYQVHVLGRGRGEAHGAALGLFGLGIVMVLLGLFTRVPGIVVLLGGALLSSALCGARGLQWRQSPQSASQDQGHPSAPWPIIGIGLCLTILAAGSAPHRALAAPPLTRPCDKAVQGRPRHHHLLALDLSGSVLRHTDSMRALLACYADMFTLPGEDIALIVFGKDEQGTAEVVDTFTVPPSGSTARLYQLLEDLAIQNPRHTRTLFRPVADLLNQILVSVHLEPVIIVVSDGQSDGVKAAVKSRSDGADIPFASLAGRGLYSAPGMRGWQVAITGGSRLDLTALFQQPLPPRRPAGGAQPLSGRRERVALDPCLIDPTLTVEAPPKLLLFPTWNPFARTLRGTLTLTARQACTLLRFRSFTVQLRWGHQEVVLGQVLNTLLGPDPHPFHFPVTLPRLGAAQVPPEAVLQILLDQGQTTRTLYPQPATLTVEQMAYWRVYSGPVLGMAGGCLVLVGGILLGVHQVRRRAQQRPEIVKVLGEPGVLLTRSQTITMGGEGSTLVIPGLPARELATAQWQGQRGELLLRPSEGVRLTINGADVTGSAVYRLGQLLQCEVDGVPYMVTLHPGTERDLSLGAPLPGSWSGASAEAFPPLSDGFPTLTGRSPLAGSTSSNGTHRPSETSCII